MQKSKKFRFLLIYMMCSFLVLFVSRESKAATPIPIPPSSAYKPDDKGVCRPNTSLNSTKKLCISGCPQIYKGINYPSSYDSKTKECMLPCTGICGTIKILYQGQEGWVTTSVVNGECQNNGGSWQPIGCIEGFQVNGKLCEPIVCSKSTSPKK